MIQVNPGAKSTLAPLRKPSVVRIDWMNVAIFYLLYNIVLSIRFQSIQHCSNEVVAGGHCMLRALITEGNRI